MNTRRFWSSLGVAIVLLSASLAFIVVPRSEALAKSKTLVGSWSIVITVVKQNSTFPGFMSFFNDGNVITDEVPSPFETSGHGNWVSTGRAEAAYAFEALVGNTDGNLLYRLKVSGTVEYNVRTDTWNGPFNIDIYDADGNLVLADTGTMSGTRIIVEP